ncbi:MAG: YjbQ family protein [Candidatus Nanopelagicales bacterium]
MDSAVLRYQTGDRLVTDLTGDLSRFLLGRGDGLVNVFVPHATAGLAVIELRAGTEDDLAAAIDRMLPREDIYRHRHGSRGHGRDHVLPAFLSPTLTFPVIGGEVPLGTWQSIVLVDPNVDNPDRSVRLSFASAVA